MKVSLIVVVFGFISLSLLSVSSLWITKKQQTETRYYLNEGQTRHFMRTCLKKLNGNVEIHRNQLHGPPSYNVTCRYQPKTFETDMPE